MRVIAVCCALLSAWAAYPSRPGLDRLRHRVGGERIPASPRMVVGSPVARGLVCAVAVTLLGWVGAGSLGALVGVPAGLALSVWIGRLESPEAARSREQIDRDLPLAVDLLAACVSVGRPPQDSLAIVSRAVSGALGTRFEEVAARISLGGDPVAEWARLLPDPQLGGLARTMRRSAESGAPLVEGLARLAQDHRRDRRTRTQVRARNVGVRAALPLAACFLPAFMLVGVVPTVAGSFQHLFG